MLILKNKNILYLKIKKIISTVVSLSSQLFDDFFLKNSNWSRNQKRKKQNSLKQEKNSLQFSASFSLAKHGLYVLQPGCGSGFFMKQVYLRGAGKLMTAPRMCMTTLNQLIFRNLSSKCRQEVLGSCGW
uniref:Uncharacterized protein n=1 Tax=Salix viminalis TaxID=40686 RepID=A0A6N2KBK5_SALVM